MAGVVDGRVRRVWRVPQTLVGILEPRLICELEELARRGVTVEEIRLRRDKRASVTHEGGNIALCYVASGEVMDATVCELCEHSLYAHAETIRRGYVTISGGIRVGIAGRAATDTDGVTGVYDVSALCLRLPRRIERVGERVATLIRERREGVLIYSPPGVGKTTLVRALISRLGDYGCGERVMRVAVVDTRGELGAYLDSEDICVDVLSGYPRGVGIEIAARTLNPELIVCDELCSHTEVASVIQAQNNGVPLLATAHAATLLGLLRRTGFHRLHEAKVFGSYIGISRGAGDRDYRYDVTGWEEAERYIQNIRCDNNLS